MNVDATMAAALLTSVAKEFVQKFTEFCPLAMTFGIACWAMWNATPLGAYIGAGFALFAYMYGRLITVSRGDSNVQAG